MCRHTTNFVRLQKLIQRAKAIKYDIWVSLNYKNAAAELNCIIIRYQSDDYTIPHKRHQIFLIWRNALQRHDDIGDPPVNLSVIFSKPNG